MKTDNLNRIHHVEFLLTKKCNLRCKYCFEDHEGVEDVPESLIKSYLKSNGAREFYTFGGEPLIKAEELEGLLTFIDKENLRFKKSLQATMKNVTTNGTLIEKNLDLIKKTGVHLQISLDGDELGNANRVFADGSSSFEKVSKAIELCVSNKIPFSLHGVLNKDNIVRYSNIVKFLFDLSCLVEERDMDKALTHFKGNFMMLVIEEEWTDEVIDLFLEQLEIVTQWIISLPITEAQKDILFQDVVVRGGMFSPCGAARGLKTVDKDGGIYPCHRSVSNKSLLLGKYNEALKLEAVQVYNTWFEAKDNILYSANTVYSPAKVKNLGWIMNCSASNTELSGELSFISPKYNVLITEVNRFTNYLRNKYNF